ncbi:MAG: aspartyl/asparaginyl beta-hydroxylase domain-containing protein [Aquabacterium sp.]
MILTPTKLIIIAVYVCSILFVHFRGRARLSFGRQLTDHSTFMAPINAVMYLFSKVPNRPYIPVSSFKELTLLQSHWEEIREEAIALARQGDIKASARYDDAGFNSFFKTGWQRFHLKWYTDAPHPSAAALCPKTVALLQQLPSIKAAMFASLPPGARLVRHRDPFAGSLRYHLGLLTPNDDRCFIEVDGERYSWRDGQGVMFDETYLHHAENTTDKPRIILFCDVERPLGNRLAVAFNRFVSSFLLAAASSPNKEGDPTGGINRAFGTVQKFRLKAKALKERDRTLYYVLKWLLLGGLVAWWLWP